METLISGAVLLSLIHAAIPNHWMPMVAIGRGANWSRAEILAVTAIAGFAHTASTVLIGILIAIFGYELTRTFHLFTSLVAPTVLVALGVYFIIADLRGKGHHHHHHTIGEERTEDGGSSRTKLAIVTSLVIGMFFSPCLELGAYYLTAINYKWTGILIVSVIYIFITVAGMMFLVLLALMGIKKLNWRFLERHERLMTGVVLVVVGGYSYFIGF